jgi:hypothetical protein
MTSALTHIHMFGVNIYQGFCLLGCYAVWLRSALRLLVTANVVPSSTILVTLMMDAIHSSETLVLTRATWRSIPEDSIN